MDYFDELDKKKTEAAEKKLYDDSYNKQIKNSKKVLGITFGIIAALFIILGIIFLLAAEEEKEAGRAHKRTRPRRIFSFSELNYIRIR